LGLPDAEQLEVGLHADVVGVVPARNAVASAGGASPVVHYGVVGERFQKRGAVSAVGAVDERLDGAGRNAVSHCGFPLRAREAGGGRWAVISSAAMTEPKAVDEPATRPRVRDGMFA